MTQIATVRGNAPLLALEDRIVVVTGATGNLGRAAFDAFVDAGARVALIHHSQQRLEQAFGHLPAERGLLVGDVDLADPGSVAAGVARIVDRLGTPYALFNTVGSFAGGVPAHEESWDTWEKLIAANLRTTVSMCRAVIPSMIALGRGRIVNTSSAEGLRGRAGYAAYAATKAAILRLTESLADELEDHGVTVNALLPGTMDTPANREANPEADHSTWVEPRAVADVAVFLASDAGRAVQGAAIPVTGRKGRA